MSKKKTKKVVKKATGRTVSTKTNKTKKRPSKKVSKRKPSKAAKSNRMFAGLGSSGFRLTKFIALRVGLLLLVALLGYTVFLDMEVRAKFEGQKWALPAQVYTRPMELYVDQTLDRELVRDELRELGYSDSRDISKVGRYSLTASELRIHQRKFRFWDGLREQQQVRIRLDKDRIVAIKVEDGEGNITSTEIIRLEPRLFGSVSPMSREGHEDRSLLLLEDVPEVLIEGLIATEDRAFRSHFGVNPMGIARAMLRNARAGRVVEGGSTLTQQLVKNYYLTSEVKFKRKFIELIMAVLLEIHYSKDEILQAYLNEVFFSQAGNRAIHGFALASQYFFGRPLNELEVDQLALLVGIIKGPSLYNPLRNPNNATERRNVVLKIMFEQNVITSDEYVEAVKAPLQVSANAQRAAPLSYPAFMGFVRRNLEDDYKQEDLSNDGLQIHTTLNPRIQQTLVKAVQDELTAIEKRKNIEPGSLQVAATVIRTDNGEVAAMIGDRNVSFDGFNRAEKARRPVGSLLKPFVYLTALESPEQYSLATPIEDKAIVVSQAGSDDWKPQNYDGQEHGSVMLIDALAKSYNLATVQLGMQLGVSTVSETIRRVGYHESFSELPSVLLGAVPMTVMEVGQLYLTLASGGFKTPIKGVRAVLSEENEPLNRYALDIDQVVEPEFNILINHALQEVVRSGTARSVLTGFRYDYGLAGKTGTTDEYRDSWFAGYSGNYLTVVWIGRDDNESTGLTGASGAAKVWAKTMQQIPLEPMELGYSEDIVTKRVYYSQDPRVKDCRLSRRLPVHSASLPLENLPCANRIQYDLGNNDESKHFEPKDDDATKTKKKSFWQRIFGRKRKTQESD